MNGMRPRAKKQSTFYDAQLSAQERLGAYQGLSPLTKQALKKAHFIPGQVPTPDQMDAVMQAHEKEALQGLLRAVWKAQAGRDLASVNEIIGAIRKTEVLGIPPDHPLVGTATGMVREVALEWEVKAYTQFRATPTSENYGRCWGARKVLDVLGIESSTAYPVNPWPRCMIKHPYKPGPYVIAQGDWLSKIAQRYYGAANLWDAIFESNNYDGHPDRIAPGTRISIYQGP